MADAMGIFCMKLRPLSPCLLACEDRIESCDTAACAGMLQKEFIIPVSEVTDLHDQRLCAGGTLTRSDNVFRLAHAKR